MSDESKFNDDKLVAAARLGIEAEAFMKSPIGRFLQGKAAAEEAALIEDLVRADPEDVKLNRDIRNNLHVCAMFNEWLTEAINEGLAAHHQLQIQDEHER